MAKNPWKEVSKILIEADPIALYFEDANNLDEYDTEAQLITGILEGCSSKEELARAIWQTFQRSFGQTLVGTEQDYFDIAEKIWELKRSGGNNSEV